MTMRDQVAGGDVGSVKTAKVTTNTGNFGQHF